MAPTVPSAAWAELLHAVESTWVPGGWLTISGSTPVGAPDQGYRDLVRDGRVEGVRVALDAEGDRLRLGLEAQPDVVKVNALEARGLLGRADVAARRCARRGREAARPRRR